MKITHAVRHRRNNSNFQLLGQAHATAAPKAVAEGRLRLETVELPTCNVLAGVDRSRTDQGDYDGFHIAEQNGGYFCLLFFWVFFKDSFFVFQHGAAFLAICCILELKSVFCMHFGARISQLRAHLAFGFWLLAFGFWLWLHLASLSFTWLMAHGFCFFGFWFWFHLALVLAVHFTWLFAFVGFSYCSLHITFHVIHCI